MIEEDNVEYDDLENETGDEYECDDDNADYSLDESDYILTGNNVQNINIGLNNSQKIEWHQSLSVDIPEIDELQKKVFGMLNGLINNNVQEDDIVKDGAAMVSELTEYSRYYFSKEEEYLRRCSYPDIDCHSKEHRQFIKNTINLRRQVSEDKKNLSYETVSNLRDWLVSHICQKDHSYVPFVRINNYVEECRLRR